jgi:hypothetical protein
VGELVGPVSLRRVLEQAGEIVEDPSQTPPPADFDFPNPERGSVP